MENIIIALDFSSKEEVYEFLSNFKDEKLFLKIGMELYYKEGNEFVKEIKNMGHNIFLDLKLLDIPNTVNKAIKNLVKLDVDFITVHTLGGLNMLRAAQEAVEGSNTKLLGVTILTSLSSKMLEQELNIKANIVDQVKHLASEAMIVGLYGVVCSPLEVDSIKGMNLNFVTPGIRLEGDSGDDQQRIMTPQKALENGSDFLVIGRSITKKENPYNIYLNIKKKINS